MIHLFRRWQSAWYTWRLIVYMAGLQRAHLSYNTALADESLLEFMTPAEITQRRDGAYKAFKHLLDRSVRLQSSAEIRAYAGDIRAYVKDPWAYFQHMPPQDATLGE